METITVSGRRDFVDAIMDRDLALSKSAADELWRIWEYRHRNGADEDRLVFVPKWFSENDFGKQRPYFFAGIEHETSVGEPDEGAILFRDVRLIDPSIPENEVWSEVSLSDAVEKLDLSKDPDSTVDEPGKTWVPKSLTTLFEMGDDV